MTQSGQFGAGIVAIDHYFPLRIVSNEELASAMGDRMSAPTIYEKTGIRSRHWATPEESGADMGLRALTGALSAGGVDPKDIQRLIYVSSTAGDHVLPSTANVIHHRAGLRGDAFEINNACTGFLTALDIASRAVVTGSGPVAIVASEPLSYFISPREPRCYSVFGDGAVAAIIDRKATGGILWQRFRNDGSKAGLVQLQHQRSTGAGAELCFRASGKEIRDEALSMLCGIIIEAMEASNTSLEALDWFLPHQPNGRMLAALLDHLKVPETKTCNVVRDRGSLGSVAVPASLSELNRAGKLKIGDKILLASVGVGLSVGAILYEW